MIRRFSVNYAVFSMILDGLIVSACLWLSSALRPFLGSLRLIKQITEPVTIPAALYLIFPILWVLILLIVSIYDGKKYLHATDEFGALTLGGVIASISSAGILYFSYREVSRAEFLLFILLSFFFLLLWRIIARLIFRVQKSTPAREKRIIIIGSGPIGQKVSAYLQETDTRNMSLLGFVDNPDDPHTILPLLGETKNIKPLVINHQASDVIIALPYSAYSQLNEIIQQLEDLPVKVWIALGFFDLALYKTSIEDFSGIPMIDLRASAINDYQLMVKRVFDLILSSTAMLILLPFFLIISIVILVFDGRPIFFRQRRAGTNGREFEMLKFRTMVRNADELPLQVQQIDENGNKIYKTKGDPRITKTGRFLRRFSLDEIPQLINILKGEMSLVGPRPELPELVEKYQPWQRKRFAIPQGLTGWWQIRGRSDKPMYLHTEDDIYYIQHYSIWLDIYILINTFWVVLRGKGAY